MCKYQVSSFFTSWKVAFLLELITSLNENHAIKNKYRIRKSHHISCKSHHISYKSHHLSCKSGIIQKERTIKSENKSKQRRKTWRYYAPPCETPSCYCCHFFPLTSWPRIVIVFGVQQLTQTALTRNTQPLKYYNRRKKY